MRMMRAGRARRKMEMKIFRPPENMSGHNPGHDHGHGNQCPVNVMANLRMPMFPVEQAAEPCCRAHREPLKRVHAGKDTDAVHACSHQGLGTLPPVAVRTPPEDVPGGHPGGALA